MPLKKCCRDDRRSAEANAAVRNPTNFASILDMLRLVQGVKACCFFAALLLLLPALSTAAEQEDFRFGLAEAKRRHHISGRGFIRDWLVSDVFPGSAYYMGEGTDIDFLAGEGGEQHYEPAADKLVRWTDGRDYGWRYYHDPDSWFVYLEALPDFVRHNRLEAGVVYLAAYIESDSLQSVDLKVGVRGYTKLWFNHELLDQKSAFGWSGHGHRVFPVELQPGANLLLVKNYTLSGGDEIHVQVHAGEDGPAPGVAVSLRPTSKKQLGTFLRERLKTRTSAALEQVQTFEKKLDALRKLRRQVKDKGIRSRLTPRLEDLAARISDARDLFARSAALYANLGVERLATWYQALQAIRPHLGEIGAEIEALQTYLDWIHRTPGAGWVLAPVKTTAKIYPDSRPLKGGDRVAITACPGEYEPASFVLYALRELKNVEIHSGDLRSDAGTIPAAAVETYVVQCWIQRNTWWGQRDWGRDVLTPELLLKNDGLIQVDYANWQNILNFDGLPTDAPQLLPFDMDMDEVKQIWLTVQVPAETPAGQYRSVIRVEAEGLPASSLTLELRVLPFELAAPKLKYCMYYTARMRTQNNPNGLTPEQYDMHMADLKAHGVDYPSIYQPVPMVEGEPDFSGLQQVYEIRRKHDLLKGSIPFMGGGLPADDDTVDATYFATMRQAVEKWRRFEEQGGYPEAMWYGIDEAVGERLKKAQRRYAAINSAGGKVTVATSPGYFDIVGPHLARPILSEHAPEDIRKAHDLGFEVWAYFFPQIVREEPGLYRYNYGSWLWKSGFDGACPYCYQMQVEDPYVDGDGRWPDHFAVYPVEAGLSIPTIQWEAFREAVDDVRYLTTLEAAIARARTAVETKGGVVEDAEQWLNTFTLEKGLIATRAETIRWILALGADN